jgi:hypothetical protein
MPNPGADVCWQQWVPGAIAAGIIPNVIVDATHSMAYLKYAATWQLLTTTGQDQNSSQQLSSVSVGIDLGHAPLVEPS